MPSRRRKFKSKTKSRRRVTMGKNQVVIKWPFDRDTILRNISDNYTGIINDLTKNEEMIDLQVLNEISTIPNPTQQLNKRMLICSQDYKDERADCINYIRQIKEMISILKLGEEEIEDKLYIRKEFRVHRLIELKYLSEIQYSYSPDEMKEEIKKLVSKTGGLAVQLTFDTSYEIGQMYESLLGKKLIDLYEESKQATNIEIKQQIRDKLFQFHRQ